MLTAGAVVFAGKPPFGGDCGDQLQGAVPMPTTSVLAPMAQFNGNDRLLPRLRSALSGNTFDEFSFAVAYAKSGPLERIQADYASWRGKSVSRRGKAIFGIDQKGTSVQALTLALKMFDAVYVSNTAGNSTFHPKFYLFRGATQARAIIGSHNLTVGGTETNLEAGVEIDYQLPGELVAFNEFQAAWDDIVAAPFTLPLTSTLLSQLTLLGLLHDETVVVSPSAAKKASVKLAGSSYPFPLVHPVPPSALPKSAPSLAVAASGAPTSQAAALKAIGAALGAAAGGAIGSPTTAATSSASAGTATPATSFVPSSLVIQISPHHNGEVFLSKTAVNQNPSFFGYPFLGTTTTKAGAPGYPQRLPDPIVDITVYDAAGVVSLVKNGYGLNTVFYATKGEIRVTVSPDVRTAVAPMSILHMQPGIGGVDYIMDIYNPGSPQYAALLAVCNQTLPSGGGVARKMGWL